VREGREGKGEWKGEGRRWEEGEGKGISPQKKISGAATALGNLFKLVKVVILNFPKK